MKRGKVLTVADPVHAPDETTGPGIYYRRHAQARVEQLLDRYAAFEHAIWLVDSSRGGAAWEIDAAGNVVRRHPAGGDP